MVAIANPSLACIPEEKFLIGTSKKSCNSANSIISSKCSSINFLECPSTVPFKNTFSLAVIFISNPAPNSINGAMVPFVVTEPLYGFKIPQQAFKSVDFPDPFVPISPHASPLFTFKLTSFNARNSGTYTIKVGQKKGANPNYKITFAIGRLVIKKAPSVEPSGSVLFKKSLPFFVMKAKGNATGTRINLSWEKFRGATGYDVYWSYCTGKDEYNKLANDAKNLKYADNNLNNRREYKYFTVAYKIVKGKKVYLGKTNVVHVAMVNAAKTNAVSITVNKKAVALAKGKTFKIVKKVKLEDPKKKQLNHLLKNELYRTSNSKVATVSTAGVIKGVGKGTCYVYAFADNGVYAKIKVTVK